MKTLVYQGPGADQSAVKRLGREMQNLFGSSTVLPVTANEILKGILSPDTYLLVIPGGPDVQFNKMLAGQPNANIRRWVEGGGKLLGICGGGYYCCRSVVFEPKQHSLRVVQPRELGFYPGVAMGSAFFGGRFRYDDPRQYLAVKLTSNVSQGGPHWAFHHGGCVFVNPNRFPNVQVLAGYTALPGNPAAVVRCNVGAGTAVLTGVHPEIIAADVVGNHRTKQLLSEHEESRQSLFLNIMKELGLAD